MSVENTNLVTRHTVESAPATVVHKTRQMDSLPDYKTVSDFSDPPGVPVSPSPKNIHTSDGKPVLPSAPRAVQLFDDKEQLIYDDHAAFGDALGCPVDRPLKVVAIVGNTGDGKSYTLNHAFCRGSEVFATSPSQSTCTLGVWAAYLPGKDCLLLDTEGLLGTNANHNMHRRLLLKVFAVADIVIYLTKAARLYSDMFSILADASDAFAHHFRPDLEALAQRTGLPWSAGQLGPAVIVFQETLHTHPLEGFQPGLSGSVGQSNADAAAFPIFIQAAGNNPQESQRLHSVTKVLRSRFNELRRNVDSFSSLYYIGIQTKDGNTNFKPLRNLTGKLLQDNSVRTPRLLEHICASLQSLNARFAGDLPSVEQFTFVQQYFTCTVKCDSCLVRCCLGIGHPTGEQGHQAAPSTSNGCRAPASPVRCRYDPKLKNKLYYCKECNVMGRRTMVVPKTGESILDAARYLYSGFVLECPFHGVIYRSRNLWSPNAEPEDTAGVDWEIVHVWSGEKTVLQGIHPFSQILVDGMTTVSKQVTGLAGPPLRVLGDLVADGLAPEYWQPNSSIRVCALCKFEFPDPLADGILDSALPPGRTKPAVEPAGECRTSTRNETPDPGLRPGISSTNRKQPKRGTVLLPRTSTLTSVSDQEDDMIGQSRPKPSIARAKRDKEDLSGHNNPHHPPLNLQTNNVDVAKHHCRACGRGVCGACSASSIPVPGFGPAPVRVCDECYAKRKVHQSGPRGSPGQSVTTAQSDQQNNHYTGRRALEICSATVGSIPPIYNKFKDTFKGFARPDYWTPDELCHDCAVCDRPFGPTRRIHHCRACGRGVCEVCSGHQRPVPVRGLNRPHRVCDDCARELSSNA
ncbi:Zinc finger FYVE domain-containing protein 1 [Fasciola gigantica]|uniref:Zinc finger FYVE domain-containing protein 1 n=1 Tax=Fasciola gigantica TaxID=46835 RepID=A0A504YNF7_FASGI|nr:Zinc finger FYVE domain-containing protein 1 [Fasciola gigantica]